MARLCCILRPRLWLCGLLCVLSVVARVEAATRVPVKMPSNAVATSAKGVASKGSGVLHVDVSEGEYIPGYTPDKRVPVKVLKRIDYSIPRTITQAKSLLKANLAQALLSVAISGAVGAVGWVMSDDQTKLQRKTETVDGIPAASVGGVTPQGICGVLPASKTLGKITIIKSGGVTFAVYVGEFGTVPSGYDQYANNCTDRNLGYTYNANGYWPQSGAKVISIDEIQSLKTDLTDSDYSALDTHINAQTADWIKSLLRGACAGSLGVERCMQDLQDFHDVSGPTTVSGPSTTTTGTYTRSDGTTGTTSSTTNTTYNIAYGPDYFDYSTTVTNTTTKDGVTTGTDTTTDSPEVTEETPPEDEEEDDAPSPCASNCDGPAYTDLYKKTDKTKEHELDSYKSRVQSIPIIAAVSGLFNVSVGGACPIWSYHGAVSIISASLPIDLDFDFHCQPWFVAFGPWIKTVLLVVCTYYAIRIGIL